MSLLRLNSFWLILYLVSGPILPRLMTEKKLSVRVCSGRKGDTKNVLLLEMFFEFDFDLCAYAEILFVLLAAW